VSIVVDDRREFRGHIPGIAQMAQAARWSAFLIAEEHSTSSSQQTVGTATDDPPSLKLRRTRYEDEHEHEQERDAMEQIYTNQSIVIHSSLLPTLKGPRSI
jgi:hypothetical protein